MNTVGAYIIDPKSGDPERKRGFTVNVASPKDVTVRGNYTKGFRVIFAEAGIEMGPYPDPQTAMMIADRYAGVLERAS